LSQLLAQEVADLVAAGARLIQIDEPAILTHPEDIRLLRQVMEPLWEARGPAQLAFATYGGNAAPMYAQLESVCADLLAFDIVSAPQLVDVVAATGSGKALALGVVDGASPQLESAPAIARQVATMLRRYTFDAVHLQPSCGLRAVPCAAARAKLDLLGAVGVLVQAGEPGGVQSE